MSPTPSRSCKLLGQLVSVWYTPLLVLDRMVAGVVEQQYLPPAVLRHPHVQRTAARVDDQIITIVGF
jgi:hypothetical protein